MAENARRQMTEDDGLRPDTSGFFEGLDSSNRLGRWKGEGRFP